MTDDPLSHLPRIDALLDAADDLVAAYGRAATLQALRSAVDRARQAAREAGAPVPAPPELIAAARSDLSTQRPDRLRRVINATGVVIHTNLGRAPLPGAAVEATSEAAGFCDLEMDLATGRRGSRGARVDPLIAEACGAEDGLAVNNAAAALVLVLATLAHGRGVLVSRGELVEIGGSFRLPEIMEASGARLIEVGTTNRTRADDYAKAAAATDVALALKVHPSNYAITGFTEQVAVPELAAVCHARGLPLVYDVGSGLLEASGEPWLAGEPAIRDVLDQGADLAVCSGDKLLAGPQAGLLAGDAGLVDRCRRNPLARALRLDKLRLAALAATLDIHLRQAHAELPVWAMLRADPDELRERAEALAGAVGGEVVTGSSLVGGGAAPEIEIPSPVVRITCPSPDAVAHRLRRGEPPIVARVDSDALWLDVRTVDPGDDGILREGLERALATG